MQEPAVKVTLDVTSDSESVLEGYCVRFLKERGWNVTAPHEKWETVKDFIARLGICHQTLSRKLRPDERRPNVVVQRSQKSKRILAILSNADFDAWCVEGK